MGLSYKDLFEFGPFQMCPSERLLTKGSEAIPLTPKAFETLLLLVENAGHALDKDEMLQWLRSRPLLHHDHRIGYTLIHAGLPPSWDLADAQRLAHEAEIKLQSNEADDFFHHMYGDLPDHWNENLRGNDRLRVIINAFTRLRYCDLEGNMDLRPKGPPGSQPPGLLPWFQVPGRRSRDLRIVFGHWSALGLWHDDGVIGLDSGCLWGRSLSAVRLDSNPVVFFSVPCKSLQAIHDD